MLIRARAARARIHDEANAEVRELDFARNVDGGAIVVVGERAFAWDGGFVQEGFAFYELEIHLPISIVIFCLFGNWYGIDLHLPSDGRGSR